MWLAPLLALLVYAPSLGGGFLYDDGEAVLRNPAIRDLGRLKAVLLYEPARPLLTLSFALNYAAAGFNPWPYHLVNVLLHVANAALVASLFAWMGRRRHWPAPAALLGACLFAVTPMAAETVAYVASRSTALAALFSLSCLRLMLNVLDGTRRLRLGPALLLYLLALGTKEEAASVPLLLLVLDYFFVAELSLAKLRQRWALHAPFWALLVAGLIARRILTGAWLPPQAIDPSVYLLTQWAALPLYFLRSLVPFDPAFYRFHPPAAWPADLATLSWSLVALVMVAVAIWQRRRLWPWSLALACLVAGLLPSSSIVSLNEMVVDHRAYLGSFGAAFALGGLLWNWGGWRLGALALGLCAATSVRYEWVLADPVRAWEHAVQRAPDSPDAACALGEAYAERGDGRAEGAFLRATQLDPSRYRVWANLGLYYSNHGRVPEGIAALQQAVRLAPGNAPVRDYLGQLLLGLGRVELAIAEFEAAIAAEPHLVPPYLKLARVRLERKEIEQARALVEAAVLRVSNPEEAAQIEALREALR